MKFVPFRAAHFGLIDIQGPQLKYEQAFTPEIGRTLEGEWSWSAVADGEVVACAGIFPIWQGRAVAWALLSGRLSPARFVAVHRQASIELERCAAAGFWRIEADVDPAFPGDRAVRWARLLGFENEGLLKRYLPNGSDMMRMVKRT